MATSQDLTAASEVDSDEEPPLDIQELLQLQHLGIASNHVTWTRVTMTSDSHICLKRRGTGDKQLTAEQVVVLGLESDACHSVDLPKQADQCMVNPVQQGQHLMMAVKVGDELQILSVPGGEPMYTCTVPNNTHFWTWLDHQTIGLVTETTVSTWAPQNGSHLKDVFTRCKRLDDAEIVGLKSDPHQQWFALVGLLPEECDIVGLTELYCVDQQLSQCICAHAVTFCEYKFVENQHCSTVMCAATRDSNGQGKFHVVELSTPNAGNLAPCSLIENIDFPHDEQHRYDFPMAIQVSSIHGLVYIMSKYGVLFVCDLETGACLCAAPVAEDVVFTSALNTQTQGLIGISVNGKVVSVDIKIPQLLQCCEADKPSVAARLKRTFPTLCET